MATTTTVGSRRATYPILTQGGRIKRYTKAMVEETLSHGMREQAKLLDR